jgi:hypothetical protein
MVEAQRRELDAVRAGASLDELDVVERGDQRALADLSLADEEQLGLVLRLGVVEASQVSEEVVDACLQQSRDRVRQWISVEVKDFQVRQLRELPRKRADRVLAEVQ